eukprot:1175742-Prorocentrum_minimum.AAC.2
MTSVLDPWIYRCVCESPESLTENSTKGERRLGAIRRRKRGYILTTDQSASSRANGESNDTTRDCPPPPIALAYVCSTLQGPLTRYLY